MLPLLYLSSHSLFKRLECNLLTEAKGPQGYTGRLRQNGELSYSIPKTQQQQCLGDQGGPECSSATTQCCWGAGKCCAIKCWDACLRSGAQRIRSQDLAGAEHIAVGVHGHEAASSPFPAEAQPQSPGRAPHPEHHRLRADGTFCPCRQLAGDSNQGSLLTKSTRYGVREQAKVTFFFFFITN